MTPTGPDQRDCAECKKPIGNRPRITRATGKVVCEACYHKPAKGGALTCLMRRTRR